MGSHTFTFSPRGHGLDCYRIWEAILTGSIPIVIHSELDYLYEELPILFIDDWKEVDKKFLRKRYKEMSAKDYDYRKLTMDYWIEKIEAVRAHK